MEQAELALQVLNEETRAFIFRIFLFKIITAVILLGIIIYATYKLIKYYENKDIEINISYKEKAKNTERKEPKL